MLDMKLLKKIDNYYSDIEKSGGVINCSRFKIKIKAVLSFVVWGTSFSEYFGYRFWERSFGEKKTYMTRRHMFKFFDRYNPYEYRERIGDKSVAPAYYGEFLQREQIERIDGFEKFKEFCEKYKKIFIKKKIGWGGEEASIYFIDNPEAIKIAWENLTDDFVAEPLIENCDEIKQLYPGSLNTIKVTVLMVKNKPEIEYALFRIGNGTPVDNVHLGGMGCGVNIETGEVETAAYDKHFYSYTDHPITHKRIIGFRIPQWEAVKQFALDAARVTPQLRYTSWDIAVTDNGLILLEGNWDAEFYAEQMIYNCGNRKKFIEKLEQ